MKFDIVFVTYNSEKWIPNCLKSIQECDYNLKDLHLYFYDNHSQDNTIELLNKYKYASFFGEFKIIKGSKNIGFGRGNNIASKEGASEYIFFLNIDTEIYPDTFKKLAKEIEESQEEFSVFELCQTPYEHPKYYNPYTMETSWASGACIVFKREVFEKLKGFDKNLFMYCEDVEISWNARRHGYKIKYLWNVPIKHYSYASPNEFKLNQFIYAVVNNLYLRAKHGSLRNYLKGILLIRRVMKWEFRFRPIFLKDKSFAKKIKHKMQKESFFMLFKSLFAFIKNKCTIKVKEFKPKFVSDFDYEVNKLAPFYQLPNIKLKKEPLVSILIRTHERSYALRETLKSIENQTYKNIEIIIVEDGKSTSDQMIKNEFSHLKIKYKATEKNVGRSKAGNLAMKMAEGKYLNFLDDDDLFYPDHVETLVKELESHPHYSIAYTTAFETKFEIYSKKPYLYEVKEIGVTHSGKFSKLNLYQQNITPIQSVMFKKDVFLECGGIDETIDACEDWDLWIRYSLKYSFLYIEKTTSLYRTPFNQKESVERQQFLDNTLKYLNHKFQTYRPEITVQDINNKK